MSMNQIDLFKKELDHQDCQIQKTGFPEVMFPIYFILIDITGICFVVKSNEHIKKGNR